MSRSIVVGILAGAGIALSSAANAGVLAAAMPSQASSVIQVQYYPPCPPGYKVTSHGVCKPSNYLRRHPNQDPYSEAYQRPRRNYGYDDQPRYPRRYQRPAYDGYNDNDGDY